MTQKVSLLIALAALQTVGAHAQAASSPIQPEVGVVRTTAQIEQFCAEGFMPGADRKPHQFLSDWARERRFLVERSSQGVTVIIVPPPSVRETREAVADLTQFFGVFAEKCPDGAEVLPILSTGVQGLSFVEDDSGVQDFEFTP